MNRIREIRKSKGVSAEELAARVGTSPTQVRRLETGSRKLTVEWMRSIAEALGVHPAELLDVAARAEICDDVAVEEPAEVGNILIALRSKSMRFYRVITDAVADAGLMPGAVVLADESIEAARGAKSGDLVLAEVPRSGSSPVIILRVLVWPDLLVTNRAEANVAIKSSEIDARIIGVVALDQTKAREKENVVGLRQ